MHLFDIIRLLLVLMTCSVSSYFAQAQDISNLGGALTSQLPGHHAIQLPAPNVTDRDRFLLQISGFSPFHQIFTKKEGLGPFFNNSSCGGCHVENGKGPAKFSRAASGNSTMIVKVSLRGLGPDGAPRDVPGIGEQLLDHSVSGKPPVSISLKWIPITGEYGDGKKYTLRKPDVQFLLKGNTRRKIAHSLRMSPALIGLGLLEAIPESTILALSDPDDINKDGISGKPQYIKEGGTGEFKLGRFGFRASHSSVEQQSAAAAFHDMGITTTLFPEAGFLPEFLQDLFISMVFYQEVPGVPPARDQDLPDVMAGKQIFQNLQCNACHIMTLKTGESVHPELANQEIHPFTDLLLHDMGRELADKRAEYSATGSEWRTTPLWGIGATFSNVKSLFLHDGRARTMEEAILWHGGEAASARNRFKNLAKAERMKLVAFLRSL